jgi:hypothetical protein
VLHAIWSLAGTWGTLLTIVGVVAVGVRWANRRLYAWYNVHSYLEGMKRIGRGEAPNRNWWWRLKIRWEMYSCNNPMTRELLGKMLRPGP